MKAPLRVATVSIVFGIDALLSVRGTCQRIETRRPPETHRSGGRDRELGSTGERLSSLEQGLEAAEHVHPAVAGHALGGLRCALELVVDDRQQRRPVLLGLDLPADAARLLD